MGLSGKVWDSRADDWAKRSDSDRARAAAAARITRLLCFGPGNGSAVDLGCGTGLYALEFASVGLSSVGVDSSEKMLMHARRIARRRGLPATFVQADLNQPLPFEPAAFDYALSHLAFDHVTQPLATLERIRAILRPGGHLALITLSREPGPLRTSGRRTRAPYPLRRAWRRVWRSLTHTYTPEELHGLARGAGFEIVDVDESDNRRVAVTLRA